MSDFSVGDHVRVVHVHPESPDHHLLGETGELVEIHADAPDGDYYGVRLDAGISAGATLFFWHDELVKESE